MSDAVSILAALQTQYPVPKIDPQWVQECYQALLDDGQQPDLEAVHEQYLFSDLSQSTIAPPASLIPPNAHKIMLFPRPTLLQIMAITEIGSSAFQLQNVAEQRKDILSGQTLIRRMDDNVDDDAEDEASRGKLPAYPRGMLKLELSVGDERVIKAMEYRRLDAIKLGETGLGAKILVQNVKSLRGILMLEPANTEFLGMLVDHLEADQPANFLAGLARRMGKPVPGEDLTTALQPPPPRIARLPTAVRNPQPASTRNGHGRAGSSRPRETQTRLSFSPSKSPVKSESEISPPLSARRPSRAASQAASARVAGLYQQTRLTETDAVDATPNKRSRQARQSGRMLPPPVRVLDEDEDEDDFDVDFDDSFLREVDVVTATATHAPLDLHPDPDPDPDEWDYADDDSSFIRHVDEAEAQAQARGPKSSAGRRSATTTTTTTASRYFDRPGTTSVRQVYEVDSDGDSSKENIKPTEVVYISD